MVGLLGVSESLPRSKSAVMITVESPCFQSRKAERKRELEVNRTSKTVMPYSCSSVAGAYRWPVKLDFLIGPGMGGQQLTLDWLGAESFSIPAKEVRGLTSLASYKGSAKRS